MLYGGVVENVGNGFLGKLGGLLKGGISNFSQGKDKQQQQEDPIMALQRSELVKNAIFGNSIQQNINELNKTMAMNNSQPVTFNSARIFQRQYEPNAFTNNQGRYL